MRRRRKLSIMVAVLAAAGCAPLSVTTDYDPERDIAALASFHWKGAPADADLDPKIASDLFEQRVKRSVVDVLEGKGLRRTGEPGAADIWVYYYASLETKTEVDTLHYTYGYRWWSTHPYYGMDVAAESRTREYEQGTLIIDLVDPETERLVWRGTAEGQLHQARTPEARAERVREAVAAMFRAFPPGKGE